MRTLVILGVVIIAVVFAIPAFCVEAKAPAAATVKGTITKIVPVGEAVEISVKDKSATETIYKLYKETKVTKGGKVIETDDILVEDTVTITKQGDVVETVEVEIIPATEEGIPLTIRSGAPVTTATGEAVTTKSAETK